MATQFLRRSGIVALAVASTVLVAAPHAQAAALPQVAQQMYQAMQNTHSYKMTMDFTDGTASKTHMVAIYVRSGKNVEYYMKMQLSMGSAAVRNTEMIMSGTQICIKGITGPQWTCSKSSVGLSQIMNMVDVSKLAESMGHTYSFKPIGSATVQGHSCTVFAFGDTSPTDTAKGTLWIDSSSHLLIEEDVTSSMTLVKGMKPTSSTTKLVVSNYNDPSLTIPKM